MQGNFLTEGGGYPHETCGQPQGGVPATALSNHGIAPLREKIRELVKETVWERQRVLRLPL